MVHQGEHLLLPLAIYLCSRKRSFLDANDATLIEHVSYVWSARKLISLF
jgi:hypothetical protein